MPQKTRPAIGLITGTDFSIAQEFTRYFQDEADVVVAYIQPRRFAFDDFEYVVNELQDSALTLMRHQPAALAFASMSITCLHGPAIINRLEQQFGVPVLVTAQAAVDSLHRLGYRRIAILSPFGAALNLLERCFFERNGIEVVHFFNLFGPQNEDKSSVINIQETQILDSLTQDLSDIDAVLLDSPTFPTLPDTLKLRSVTSVPVLSANLALAKALRRRLAF